MYTAVALVTGDGRVAGDDKYCSCTYSSVETADGESSVKVGSGALEAPLVGAVSATGSGAVDSFRSPPL